MARVWRADSSDDFPTEDEMNDVRKQSSATLPHTVFAGNVAEPVWLDTVVVPSFGSVTFRSRFLDFPGKFMLHCHMMNHEELGMMQVVEVYTDA